MDFEPRDLLKHFTVRNLLIAMLFVGLLSFIQVRLVAAVKERTAGIDAAELEKQAAQTALTNKSLAVAYYKSNMNLDEEILPVPAESQTRAYSAVVDTFDSFSVLGASIAKESEDNETVVFRVTGEADYFHLLRILVSFRENRYMMRINDIEVTKGDGDTVHYSFALAVKVVTKPAVTAPSEPAVTAPSEVPQ